MTQTKILVVEDQNIVALDIQNRLRKLGYDVVDVVSSGESALSKAGQLAPDLILMDVHLKGAMDGVEAAEQIGRLFHIPIIYLTAYADERTLDRAKLTQPYAFLVKPFEEKELHSAIQTALYRHAIEVKLRESEERFRSLIENASDIVVVLDAGGQIRYIGPSVRRVLGYEPEELLGKSVIELVHEEDARELGRYYATLARSQVTLLSGEARVRHKDGTWRHLEATGRNRLDDPAVAGLVFNLRDVTSRKEAEEELRERERFLALLNSITHAALETPDLKTMLHTLASRLGELIGADSCYITLWNEKTGRVIPTAAYGLAQGVYPTIRTEPGERTMTEHVLDTGRSLVVEDVFDSPLISPRLAQKMPDRSLLALPLIAADQKLGAALIGFHHSHQFTLREIMWGEQAAGHIALAMAKARLLETERDQRVMAETLAQVTVSLTSQTDYGAVLDEILCQAQRIVPHSTANIALLENATLRMVRWRGYQDRMPQWEVMAEHLVQRLDDWAVDKQVIESMRPRVVADTQAEPRWIVLEDTAWIRSYLSVPICLRERALGVLRLDSDLPGRFSEEDAARLAPLASAAAIAIDNARLFAEARQRVDELETLRHTSLQITSMLDLPAVLDTIAQSAVSLVGASDCHIFLYDAATGRFAFGAALWEDGRREPAVVTPRAEGFTAAVVREGRSIVINDALHHPLFVAGEAKEWHVHAIAGFPLKRGARITGVLSVAFLEPHAFTEDELRVLDLLADQAVIAIDNARLVAGLEAEVAARTAEIVAEKERSEAILRGVGDAIIMIDPELCIRYVNPAFNVMTGYTLEEAVGQRVDLLNREKSPEQWNQFILPALAAAGAWQGELTLCRKDGRTYDAAVTVAPVRDAAGMLVGYVCSHHDVSRIKELDRARSRFITNVSHQLRTPVTNLKLYARLLRGAQYPEKAAGYVQVLEDQASQLSELIQDILEVTALDSGQGVIEWEPISLPSVITEAFQCYRKQLKAAGLNLEILGSATELPAIVGDAPRLVQALGELLENAIHFTPAGGSVQVQVQQAEEDGRHWVTVSVRDSGPGIPADEREHIFDRFYRGRLAESGHISGTGLGLSIVAEIMHAHGGRVTVESNEGSGWGTTFTLWLPAPRLGAPGEA